MKRILLLFSTLLITTLLNAQAPQGINYQGVARDVNGNAISKQLLSLEFKIWQGNPSSGGSIIYSETYSSVQTDTFGLYILVIGKGTQISASAFNQIPWAAGNMWVEVYIDPANGTNYHLVSGTQLMSVPYALYAASSGSGGGGGNISGTPNNIPKINPAGNGIKNSLIYESTDSSSIGINTSNPLPGAALEITSVTKGLLIPRMSYSQRNAITNLHHGLMVFQIDNPSALTPEGFWYYDTMASSWLFLPPAQAVWTLAGNYGTNPSSNFIGSIDDKDVIFKTGSTTFSPTERMRMFSTSNGGNIQFGDPTNSKHYIFPAVKGNAGDILQLDPSGTNKLIWKPISGGGGLWTAGTGSIFPNTLTDIVGIGTNSPQATLDILSSSNNNGALNVVNTNTTGAAGTFTNTSTSSGNVVLDVGSAGSGNAINATAVSGYALSGVAQGGSALWVQNNSTNQPTVDAASHGSASAGNFQITNSSNGNAALMATTSGTGDAVYGNLSNNGTAIVGYNSGGGKAGSFSMVSNSSASDALYAVTTSSVGGFSGNFVGGAGLKTDKFTMTNTAGTVGFVLTEVNTSGGAVWAPVAGSANFSVPTVPSQTFTANNTIATGLIQLGAPSYIGGGVNFSNNAFVAPSAGIYHFDAEITISNTSALSGGTITLYLFDPIVSAVYRQIVYNNVPAGGAFTQTLIISTDLSLNVGQKVDLRLTNTSTGTSYTINSNINTSWFNGHKIF